MNRNIDGYLLVARHSLLEQQFVLARGLLFGFMMLLELKPGHACDRTACLLFPFLTGVPINHIALLKAFSNDSAVSFHAPTELTEHCFTVVLKDGVFKDHDVR